MKRQVKLFFTRQFSLWTKNFSRLNESAILKILFYYVIYYGKHRDFFTSFVIKLIVTSCLLYFLTDIRILY